MLSKLETGEADLYRQQLEDLVRLRTPGAEARCHSLWNTSSQTWCATTSKTRVFWEQRRRSLWNSFSQCCCGTPSETEDSENGDIAHCGTALHRSNYDNNDDNIVETIGAARTASKANIAETLGAVWTVSKANKEKTLWIALVASQTPSTAKEAETLGVCEKIMRKFREKHENHAKIEYFAKNTEF